MLVKELIDELSKYPQDMNVAIVDQVGLVDILKIIQDFNHRNNTPYVMLHRDKELD